jgi:hypothetical protein
MFLNKEFGMRINDLVGKEVQIYPGDSESKFGIIQDMNDQGVLFLITKSKSHNYPVGSFRFISYSASLSFSVLKD